MMDVFSTVSVVPGAVSCFVMVCAGAVTMAVFSTVIVVPGRVSCLVIVTWNQISNHFQHLGGR